MKKVLKFDSKKQNIFVVSDLHAHHDRFFIWQKRGYSCIQAMNDDIIKKWHQYITPNDIVFNLGDVVFKDGDGKKARALFSALHCKHHYILFGNHNSGVKQLYEEAMIGMGLPADAEFYPLSISMGNVTFLGHYQEVEIDDRIFVMSHFPISSWHKFNQDSIHLHGHCHDNLKEKLKNRMDVGWDVLKRPFEIKEIIQILNSAGGEWPNDSHREKFAS